jgi:hypothetical protein
VTFYSSGQAPCEQFDQGAAKAGQFWQVIQRVARVQPLCSLSKGGGFVEVRHADILGTSESEALCAHFAATGWTEAEGPGEQTERREAHEAAERKAAREREATAERSAQEHSEAVERRKREAREASEHRTEEANRTHEEAQQKAQQAHEEAQQKAQQETEEHKAHEEQQRSEREAEAANQ